MSKNKPMATFERGNLDKLVIGATKQETEKFDRQTSKLYLKWAAIAAIVVVSAFEAVRYFS